MIISQRVLMGKPGHADSVSGAILYDEPIRQHTSDSVLFAKRHLLDLGHERHSRKTLYPASEHDR